MEIGEYIENLEAKIERMQKQLAQLRAKKSRSDLKALAEDNERLRAEIVRLSGGNKSRELAYERLGAIPEKPPWCAVCLNSQHRYFGKFYCSAGRYSREIINPFSGTPEWCPL